MLSDKKRTGDYVNVLLMHLMNHFTVFTLPVVILYIRDDFNIDYTTTGWLWLALVVTNTSLAFFAGFYADTHRKRRYPLIYIGMFIMIAGWFLIPLATSTAMLFPIFILIGVGASTYHPTAFVIITEMYDKDKGKALSYNMAIGMLGTAVAPILFAGLVVVVGGNYHTAIFAVAVIFLAVALASLLYMQQSGSFHRIDWRSDDDRLLETKESSTNIWFLLSPLILVPLLFTSIRGSFFRTSALFSSLLYEDYLGLNKEQASIATAIILGISSLFTILGGWITDKFLPRVAILISSIGTLIAAYGLVYLNNFSLINFSIFFFGLNTFYYIGSPAASTLLANRTRPEQRGKLYGAFFSLGQVLSLASPLIFGILKDSQGIGAAFFFLFALSVIAFFIGVYIYYEEKNRLKNIDDHGQSQAKEILVKQMLEEEIE